MICGDVCAETIFLKSGRIIKCSKINKENDVIKCFVNGYEVGFPVSDVDKVVIDHNSKRKSIENGFTFDHWQSGMSIEEVMIVAQRKDIPLNRHGLISADKHFNPKMSREFIHTVTEFSYKDQLMGKNATVTLYFTPKSKLLEKIKIRLYSSDINRKSSYPKEIASMLSEKYGKPSHIIDMNIFHDSISWKGNNNFTVLMVTGIGLIDITYSDIRLQLTGQKERNAIEAKNSEKYHLKDDSKF
jgi:hypothetical protein